MTFHTSPLSGVAVQVTLKLPVGPAVIVSTAQATPFAPVPRPEIVMLSVAVRFAIVMPDVFAFAVLQVVRAAFAFVQVPSSITLIAVPPPTVSVLPLTIDVSPFKVTVPVPDAKVFVPL